MLTIDNITYTYPQSSVTYRYDLEVASGEIAAVLGASGSGKSTLLDIIAGFLRAEEGSIALDGAAFTTLPAAKRPLSILFQKHNLFEHLSVMKNLLLGMDAPDHFKAESILEEVGLKGYGEKMASMLSGGQQQRVALARVLLRDRPVLLLDEPFNGLDSAMRREMLELVERMTHSMHLHTVMVTHDMSDVDAIASRAYEMKGHRLEPVFEFKSV
jgi:thiamine transport system ATP-binding protein